MATKSVNRKSQSLAHKVFLANIGLYERLFQETRKVAANAGKRAARLFEHLVEEGEEIETDVAHRIEHNQVLTMGEKQIARVSLKARRKAKAVLSDVREATGTEAITGKALRQTAKRVIHDIAGDDLTKIKGIGPKRADDLHAEGIRTFEQLALMKKVDMKKMDDKLGLGGRSLDGDWRGQAKQFAIAAN